MRHLLILGLVVSSLAIADSKSRRLVASAPSERHLATPDRRILLGVASDSVVTNSTDPALSAWIDLSPNMSLQSYALIGSVDPFTFSLGANLKFTVIGTTSKGFHVAPGVGFGTYSALLSTPFFFRFNALAGFHFLLVDRVMVNVDSGATLMVNDGNFNFKLAGNSQVLGVSLLFQL